MPSKEHLSSTQASLAHLAEFGGAMLDGGAIDSAVDLDNDPFTKQIRSWELEKRGFVEANAGEWVMGVSELMNAWTCMRLGNL